MFLKPSVAPAREEVTAQRIRGRPHVVILVSLVFALSAAVAFSERETNAYPGWGTYTKNSPSGNDIDPVTLIFWDGSIPSGLSLIHAEIEFHLGWVSVSDANQYFKEDAVWQSTDGQRASQAGGSRYHIRMNQGDDLDANWRIWTMGSPHYEIWHPNVTSWPPSCWGEHETTTFVGARDYMMNEFFAEDHPTSSGNRINNKPLEQCDGSFVSADNRYRLIEIYY